MNGIICWPCLISDILALQLAPQRWQNEPNKNQEKDVSQPNHDLWWIWPQERLRSCLFQLQQTRGGPRMDIKILEKLLQVTIERGNPWKCQDQTNSLFWSNGKRLQQDSGEGRKSHSEGKGSSTLTSSRKAMKVRAPGVRKLVKMIKRGNPLSSVTCTQHATQGGMMTKLGLLKSGKLISQWMTERGHPLFASKKNEVTAIHHWKLRNRIRIVSGNQIIHG